MFVDRFFFALLIIFLPTQLGRHFFTPPSLISGVRVDYLAPTFYLSDLLLILTIIFWLLRIRKRLKKATLKFLSEKKITILLISLLILINLTVASSGELALFKIIKIFELLLLATYLLKEKISFKQVVNYLLIGGLYSSILAVVQFVKQGSWGGWWWFLGERTFTLQTPGIAKAIVFGKLFFRPYATFPHPNVLGGFFALLLPFLITALFKAKKEAAFFLQPIIILFTITLLLTFSRIPIIIGVISILVTLFSLKKTQTTKFFIVGQLLILVCILILFAYPLFGRFQSLTLGLEETLFQRKELLIAATEIFKKHLFFGVGLNNFLLVLPSVCRYCQVQGFFQPVHNTFLLIMAETGIFGLAVFIFLLLKAVKNIHDKSSFDKPIFYIVFGEMLIFLLNDHYFFTLQQGQLLFTILISFMIKKDNYYA